MNETEKNMENMEVTGQEISEKIKNIFEKNVKIVTDITAQFQGKNMLEIVVILHNVQCLIADKFASLLDNPAAIRTEEQQQGAEELKKILHGICQLQGELVVTLVKPVVITEKGKQPV